MSRTPRRGEAFPLSFSNVRCRGKTQGPQKERTEQSVVCCMVAESSAKSVRTHLHPAHESLKRSPCTCVARQTLRGTRRPNERVAACFRCSGKASAHRRASQKVQDDPLKLQMLFATENGINLGPCKRRHELVPRDA